MSSNQTVTFNSSTLANNVKTQTLILALDPGTSCTKSIYSKGRRGKLKHLVSSSVIYPTSIEPAGEDTYVKLPQDDLYYLVGESAVQAKVQSSIRQLKSESIIPKVLGVIGEIAQQESFPSQFSLKLSLLLPMSEMSDQEFIKSKLTEALSNFSYNGNSYQVETSSFRVRPEGSGVYTYLSRSTDPDLIRSQTCAYLMFGYRNTSLLLIEGGKFNQRSSHSTDLGFYNYLDLVGNYSSGLYREDIQKAIVTEATHGVDQQSRQIIKSFSSKIRVEDLIRSSNLEGRKRESNSISAAIKRADTEYWQLLNRWLQEKLPPLNQLDQVVVCGGATFFIEVPINNFFQNWQGNLITTSDISIKMLNKLNLSSVTSNKFIKQCLPVRLVDVFGEFVDLSGTKI